MQNPFSNETLLVRDEPTSYSDVAFHVLAFVRSLAENPDLEPGKVSFQNAGGKCITIVYDGELLYEAKRADELTGSSGCTPYVDTPFWVRMNPGARADARHFFAENNRPHD